MKKSILFIVLAITILLTLTVCPQIVCAIDIYAPDPANEVFTCSDFDMVIRPASPHMKGADVIELQMLLKKLDYYPGPIHGLYDELTEKSLKKFQQEHGLKPDGWAKYSTWQALTEVFMEVAPVSAAKPTGPIHIVIDKSKRKLYLYNDKEIYKEYPVAVGKAETPTPVGEWKIVSKGIWGGGFGTRWMGLNVPWGKYGIHGTNKPYSIGTYASHGCIRMFNRDVEELYSLVDIGTPVIIQGDFPHLTYRTIKPGTAAKDMLHVQKRLRDLGVYWGPIDGRYGKMTEMAAIYFQLLNNKEADGVIDDSYYQILQLK